MLTLRKQKSEIIGVKNKYIQTDLPKGYSASQLRSKYLYDFSGEQFYHHFIENFPEFTQRVPQHLLTSYLNMTPEYLSKKWNKFENILKVQLS